VVLMNKHEGMIHRQSTHTSRSPFWPTYCCRLVSGCLFLDLVIITHNSLQQCSDVKAEMNIHDVDDHRWSEWKLDLFAWRSVPDSPSWIKYINRKSFGIIIWTEPLS